MLKRLLFLIAFAIVASPLLYAQITTSSLTGTVTSSTQENLVGATIVATHLPSGTKYSTSARGAGEFIIANMRPGGPYLIEITFIGYETESINDIFLQLAESYVLRPVLTKAN